MGFALRKDVVVFTRHGKVEIGRERGNIEGIASSIGHGSNTSLVRGFYFLQGIGHGWKQVFIGGRIASVQPNLEAIVDRFGCRRFPLVLQEGCGNGSLPQFRVGQRCGGGIVPNLSGRGLEAWHVRDTVVVLGQSLQHGRIGRVHHGRGWKECIVQIKRE